MALPRVLALWTRDEQASAATGRGRIALAVRATIERHFDHRHHHLRHLLAAGPALERLEGLVEAAGGVLRRPPLPLQCRIYMPATQRAHVLAAIEAFAPDIVYLDSIRAAPLAAAIRRAAPTARLVLDMDDLMSRRWAVYRRAGIRPGFGFLERYLPSALVRSALAEGLTDRLLLTESRRLLHLELEAARHVDAIVLISAHEAAILRRLLRARGGPAGEVVSIRPPVALPGGVARHGSAPWRFVFIGTDELPQNRLTIEAILGFWERLRPATDVHVYGRMVHRHRSVEGVRFMGFAPSLEEVYSPGSILFAPSYVAGGVKTKVLEAMAWGCPVVGNRQTFEGIARRELYPLVQGEAALEDVVVHPEAHAPDLLEAARRGRVLVERHYAEALFTSRWRALLAGEPMAGRSELPIPGEAGSAPSSGAGSPQPQQPRMWEQRRA